MKEIKEVLSLQHLPIKATQQSDSSNFIGLQHHYKVMLYHSVKKPRIYYKP